MERIMDLHLDFHSDVTGRVDVTDLLEQEQITILDGFNRNIDLVRRYYQTAYATDAKRIVLCGINPGKNGAGKTGIPFLDFRSVSSLMPDVDQSGEERSAQFIFSVMQEIGQESFHQNVYMTNISWYGFLKNKNNLNFYDLPEPLPAVFTRSFIEEMEIVQPKVIIPLSEKVEDALKKMARRGELNYPIAARLPHPYYCSIGDKRERYKEMYKERILRYMES